MEFEANPDPARLKKHTLPYSGITVMLTDEEWAQFARLVSEKAKAATDAS